MTHNRIQYSFERIRLCVIYFYLGVHPKIRYIMQVNIRYIRYILHILYISLVFMILINSKYKSYLSYEAGWERNKEKIIYIATVVNLNSQPSY